MNFEEYVETVEFIIYPVSIIVKNKDDCIYLLNLKINGKNKDIAEYISKKYLHYDVYWKGIKIINPNQKYQMINNIMDYVKSSSDPFIFARFHFKFPDNIKIELIKVGLEKVERYKDNSFSRSKFENALSDVLYSNGLKNIQLKHIIDELVNFAIEKGLIKIVKENDWHAPTYGSKKYWHRCRYQKLIDEGFK